MIDCWFHFHFTPNFNIYFHSFINPSSELSPLEIEVNMPTNPLRLKHIKSLASPKPGGPTSTAAVPPFERHDYCQHNHPDKVYQGNMTVRLSPMSTIVCHVLFPFGCLLVLSSRM
jgi:hypothetical protein